MRQGRPDGALSGVHRSQSQEERVRREEREMLPAATLQGSGSEDEPRRGRGQGQRADGPLLLSRQTRTSA